ncbi:nucleotide-binding universal stress UspA family protein [Symbiobacterium terraclitae]|uniref:Nucleotide-binding universal stress UspA family protein n=1 Tax=Symbiobacterium terraclitae TaxID=557451 RepID=A0ABS4JT74_9FIRM|nr:nucleotide-binding universal stress UspA family protein [Symbiobacterium terraclitae]
MKKILLATDGSDNSLHAARMAGELGAALKDVQVIVLYVAHVPRAYYAVDEFGNKVTPEVPMDVMIRRTGEPILRKTISALGLPEEQVVTEVQVGEPAEEIVDYARLEQVDLIVMGSRGLSPIKELLVGSVSDKVLHTAPCPVLIVR